MFASDVIPLVRSHCRLGDCCASLGRPDLLRCLCVLQETRDHQVGSASVADMASRNMLKEFVLYHSRKKFFSSGNMQWSKKPK